MCEMVKYSGFSEQLLLLSGLLIFVGKLINIEIPTDRRLVGNTGSGKKHSGILHAGLESGNQWTKNDPVLVLFFI